MKFDRYSCMCCGKVRPGKPPSERSILLGMREAFYDTTLYRKHVKLLYVSENIFVNYTMNE